MNTFKWIIYFMLVFCMVWLVAVSLINSGTMYHSDIKNDSTVSKGLKCVYNCKGFSDMLEFSE